jgi:hypothetical protein
VIKNEGNMKRFSVILLLSAFLAGLFAAQGAASTRVKKWTGSRGWGPDTPYARLYNPKTVEAVGGIVSTVQRFIPGRGMAAGLHLLVRTGVEVIDVHLGPEWYIENQDRNIQPNDQIDVKGSRVIFRGQSAIIAAEVRKGDEILKLRDENGCPAWTGWRPR